MSGHEYFLRSAANTSVDSLELSGDHIEILGDTPPPSSPVSNLESSGGESTLSMQNTVGQDGAAHRDSQLPIQRIPRIEPPSFCGENEDAEEYVRRYNNIAAANRWDNATKVLLFPCYLKGTALNWYEVYKKRNEEGGMNWENVTRDFQNAFRAAGTERMAEVELTRRKQATGETIQAFIFDMLRICLKVDPLMTDRAKVGHILRGLLPHIVSQVVPMSPQTPDEVIECARRVQEGQILAGQSFMYAGEAPLKKDDEDLKEKIKYLSEKLEKFTSMMYEVNRDGSRGNAFPLRGDFSQPQDRSAERVRFAQPRTNNSGL